MLTCDINTCTIFLTVWLDLMVELFLIFNIVKLKVSVLRTVVAQ